MKAYDEILIKAWRYMNDPCQDELNKCKFCGVSTYYDFCSDSCGLAYFND